MIAQNLEWIKQGLYVDARDKHGEWEVGLVLTVTKVHIKIRFDGWASKNDELYPLNTQRIKPFRSITRGYTGTKKSPGVRQHWNFSLQNHQLRLSQFEQFVEHISQKSAFEINQYLRGQNYFYIDFLLSVTYNSVEQIIKVYDYFKQYFQFVNCYFQQFIQRDTNVWFQAGQKQQLTAKKVYGDLHFELFESIVSIIGSQSRSYLFIKNNQKLLKQMIAPETEYQIYVAKQLNRLQFFINFESIANKMLTQAKAGLRNIPYTFISSFYSLFAGLERLSLSMQFKKKINNTLVELIQCYVASMTIQDAKTNQKSIEEILTIMRILCNKLHSQKEEMCRWVEKARLKLWIYLIQCDVLQKKLRGINKIKEFYDLIFKKLSNPYQNSSILTTKAQFKQWLNEEQLLKIIFESNEHSQVIKKGCEMIQYFYACKHQLCVMEEVVFIWQTCFKKHEAIKKIIFQFWNQLPQYVTGDNDWKLFIDVLTKNEEYINQDWEMESLFGFLHALKSDDDNESISNIIQMMYRKTLNHQKYIPELARELSFFDGDSKVIRRIIDNCLTKISQKNEPIFHLKLLAKLFNQLHSYKIYLPEKIIVILIEELKDFVAMEENEKLVQTIFNLFNQIMGAKDNGASAGNPIGVKFTYENLQTLWQIFLHTSAAHLKTIFYAWMIQKSFHSTYNVTVYYINPRFTHEFRLQIFSNILCDKSKFNYNKIDIYEFAVFKQFFTYANIKAGVFEYKAYSLGPNNTTHKRILRTKSKDIQGLNQLWEIFKSCEHDDVVISASTFIKDIYLRVSTMMAVEQKTQRIKNLMEIIQMSILEGQKNGQYLLIKRILILISKLLTQIKDKVQIPKEFEKIQKTEKHTITAFISSANDAQQLQIYVEQPFINIKNLIAHKFHLAKDEFTLFNGKIQVPKELYQLPFYLHSFEENYFRIVKIGNELGKFVLSNVCQHIYHKIINFLKNEHICTEAFHLLQYLDIFEPVRLFQNLSKQIQQADQILKNKKKLYLHIYFTRVFIYIVDKQITQIDGDLLQKLISHLEIPIQSSLIVNYLEKLIQILNSFVKKKPELVTSPQSKKQLSLSLLAFRPKIYKLLLNLVKYLNRNPQQISSHELRLFNTALMLYMTGFENTKILFDSFIKDQHFRQLMFEIFIKCDVLQIKRTMERKVVSWLKEGFCSINEERKVGQFFINELYYEIYRRDSKKVINGAQFIGLFKLFRTIIQSVQIQTLRQILNERHSPIANETFEQHIFNSISKLSDTSSSTNFMLNGQLQILVAMIKRDRLLITQQLIEFLFYNCLIYGHGKTNGMEVKCLFKQNIILVLEILWYVMVDIQTKETQNKGKISILSLDNNTGTILSKFREFHYFDDWRNSRDWNYDFQELSKAKVQFVGLQNPGCICYLNSLLQQLYMIQEFRSSILNMNLAEAIISEDGQVQIQSPDQDSPELIPTLKGLFLKLMYSQRSAIDPQFFTSSIRAGNRPMVKIFEQMDIDEFSMILFDKIQNKLHRNRTPNFIRELFGGTYSNQIISQECNHSSEREEQFLSISLDVKKHITEGFQSLVKGEMLQGENAYFCDGCDKKVKALKRLSIKRLPPHLIISLRRFQFDYEADQKIKINKYCEFPFQLNLQSFSQDKLNESNKKTPITPQHKSSMSMNDQDHFKKSSGKTNFPSEYFVYRLKGVVVHSGSADSGHYYSFIESKDGNWFQFNDEKVSEFDVKHLEEEAFGGRDGEYTRIKNAYLLFYERKTKTHFNNHTCDGSSIGEKTPQRMSQQINIDQTPSGNYFQQSLNQSSMQALQLLMNKQRSLQIPQNKRTIEQIVMENKKIRLCHFFFSKEYLEFIISFVKRALYPAYRIKTNEYLKQINQYHYIMQADSGSHFVAHSQLLNNIVDLQHQIFQFLVSYTFLIQLRQKNFPLHLELLESIKKIFLQHPNQRRRLQFVELFLEQICHQSFIDEFFVNCTNKQKSRIIGNFIFEAIKSYLMLYKTDPINPFPRVIKNIIKLIIKTVIKTNTNITQLLMIIRKIVSLKQTLPVIRASIINFILEKYFVTIMVDNTLGVQALKQINVKRIKNLENDQQDLLENNNTAFVLGNSQRKNSDISAKQEVDQEAKTKKKYFTQKQQKQNPLDSPQDLRFSVLFGLYRGQAVIPTKTNEKQTWTILWQIQKEIRKKRNIVDHIRKKIDLLGKGHKNYKSIHKIKQSQNSQNSVESSIQAQNNAAHILNKSPASQLGQKKQQNVESKMYSGQKRGGQPISPTSIETTQRMQNSPLEQRQDDGTQESQSEQVSGYSGQAQSSQLESPLNEQDARQIDRTLTMVNEVYAEIASLPKQVIQVETHTPDNNQVKRIYLETQIIPGLNEPSRRLGSNLDSNNKNQNPELQLTPINISHNPSQSSPNKPQTQSQAKELTPEQERQLIQLQKQLDQHQCLYNEMSKKFNAPLTKLKTDKLMKIISEQKDTKSMIALAAFIYQLVFNNNAFNETILSSIETGFKDYESSKYRPFFIVFQKMLEIQDDLAKKRRLQILRILRNSIRSNDKYFIECDLIHQYLLKYATKFPTFEVLLRQSPSFINEIKAWVTQKKTPGAQTIKKHRQQNCQRHAFKNHGIIVSGDLKDYENLTIYKFESFEKIKQGRFTPSIKYPEEPKVGQIYKTGDLVQVFFDQNSWITGTVEETYFGMMLVNFVHTNNKSDKIIISQDEERIKLKLSGQRENKPQKMEIEK